MGYPAQQDPISTLFSILSSPLGWLIALGIIILIFLIFREILCWYWKINEGLDSLNDIKREIATTNALLRNLGIANPPQTGAEEQARPPQS